MMVKIAASTPSMKTVSINVLDFGNDAHAFIKFPVKKGLFELLEANSSNFILFTHANGRRYRSTLD